MRSLGMTRITQDWSESERAEIGRLEKVCDASEHWTLECSHTDVGDPWCIIYDQEHHRTVLHIARIVRSVPARTLERSETSAAFS